jgi:hypothetical protein
MSKRIRVRAVVRQEPDIRLYVLALLALAQQLQDAEQTAKADMPEHQDGAEEADHA